MGGHNLAHELSCRLYGPAEEERGKKEKGWGTVWIQKFRKQIKLQQLFKIHEVLRIILAHFKLVYCGVTKPRFNNYLSIKIFQNYGLREKNIAKQ